MAQLLGRRSYTLKDFFVNRYLKQVIIPEIQRDYVWQEEQLRGLLSSLMADFRRFITFKSDVQAADPALVTSFTEYQRRQRCAASIGFVYAYSDEEFAGRYFLIDGQQRITSVFLILLALAHREPATLRGAFHQIFYAEDRLKLAYHVREVSHEFLNKLVPHLLPELPATPAGQIEDQVWYYDATRPDTTIRNLVQNVELLGRIFAENDFQRLLADTEACTTPEVAFFNYLTDYTEFYYFDTNISEQGEDLYIYMNARGEQVQSNENIKADLLGQLNTLEEKDIWGRKWEDWQDFFWEHRASGGTQNENADAGFNSFLACIAGLTELSKGNNASNKKPAERSEVSRIIASLKLEAIEQYINCLRFLHDKKREFKNSYSYSGWIEKCLNEIWSIFNNERIDWFADYTGKNRGAESRRMAFIWPVLHFMVKHNPLAAMLPSNAFRILRIYYLRYHNSNRSVAGSSASSIEDETNERVQLGVFNTVDTYSTVEEKLKHDLYTAVGIDQTIQYEEIIWEIEDHELNLNGKDLGGTNISHLVDLNLVSSPSELRKIRDKFYELFSSRVKNSYPVLQNILLYYGPYQHRVSPWYYFNFNFGDWKRTIRGHGSEEAEKENKSFRCFFNDFLKKEVSLDEFLREKQASVINKEDAIEKHQKALWYSQYLGIRMWIKGNYIAFSNDWNSHDAHFSECRTIYNTQGDFRGEYHYALQDLMPKVTIQ